MEVAEEEDDEIAEVEVGGRWEASVASRLGAPSGVAPSAVSTEADPPVCRLAREREEEGVEEVVEVVKVVEVEGAEGEEEEDAEDEEGEEGARRMAISSTVHPKHRARSERRTSCSLPSGRASCRSMECERPRQTSAPEQVVGVDLRAVVRGGRGRQFGEDLATVLSKEDNFRFCLASASHTLHRFAARVWLTRQTVRVHLNLRL